MSCGKGVLPPQIGTGHKLLQAVLYTFPVQSDTGPELLKQQLCPFQYWSYCRAALPSQPDSGRKLSQAVQSTFPVQSDTGRS